MGFVHVCSLLCSSIFFPTPHCINTTLHGSALVVLLVMISARGGRKIRLRATIYDDTLGWTRGSLRAFRSEGQWEWILVWVFLLTITKVC
jgi:hypothetical protein